MCAGSVCVWGGMRCYEASVCVCDCVGGMLWGKLVCIFVCGRAHNCRISAVVIRVNVPVCVRMAVTVCPSVCMRMAVIMCPSVWLAVPACPNVCVAVIGVCVWLRMCVSLCVATTVRMCVRAPRLTGPADAACDWCTSGQRSPIMPLPLTSITHIPHATLLFVSHGRTTHSPPLQHLRSHTHPRPLLTHIQLQWVQPAHTCVFVYAHICVCSLIPVYVGAQVCGCAHICVCLCADVLAFFLHECDSGACM